MGALFDIIQDVEGGVPKEWTPPTFKDCAAADITLAFFNGNEHADLHTIDGKEALVIFEDTDLREHRSHWEAGAKQNFDTGIYTAHSVLYIQVKDYGPKPKVGKELVMDRGTDHQRTYTIKKCEDEDGVYRMILERARQ